MNKTSLLSLLVLSGVTLAQNGAPKAPTDKDMWVTSADMDAIKAKAVDKTTGAPAAFSSRLFDAGNASTAFIRLTAPDKPHAHGEWSEVFVIREGAGTLQTGGTIICPCGGDSAVHRDIFTNKPESTPPPQAAARRVDPFDKAGTSIEGGVKQKVKAGDIVLVPARVAHTWVEIESPVVYLDIKFPRPEEGK